MEKRLWKDSCDKLWDIKESAKAGVYQDQDSKAWDCSLVRWGVAVGDLDDAVAMWERL